MGGGLVCWLVGWFCSQLVSWFVGWFVRWSVGRFVFGLVGCWVDYSVLLAGWLLGGLIDYFVRSWTAGVVGLLVSGLVGGLICSFVRWLLGWLVYSVGWLVCSFDGWLVGWLSISLVGRRFFQCTLFHFFLFAHFRGSAHNYASWLVPCGEMPSTNIRAEYQHSWNFYNALQISKYEKGLGYLVLLLILVGGEGGHFFHKKKQAWCVIC